MSTLDYFSQSRNNNLKLIRFGAACGVFISHCFPLSGYGTGGKAQLLGFISLNAFFIISGFLVTKSYFDRRSVFDYLHSRALRIFPALIVAVIYSVFVVGLTFSTVPISEYLSSTQVYEYAIKHIALLLPNAPEQLPGVFTDSKYRPIVNAPLWSLPYEVWCYLALMAVALITAARNHKIWFTIITLCLLVLTYSVFVANYVSGTSQYAYLFGKEAYRLSAMFLIGVTLYLARHKIPLSHRIMGIIAVCIITSALYKPAFVAVTYALFGYFLLYATYIPNGLLRHFNKLGDYSYGIYIFGYPTQQAVEQVLPDLSLPVFFIVSFTITLLLAVLSWHYIEQKALWYKKVNPS